MTAEHYDEEKLEHQEPVQAISRWQQWNDLAISYEEERNDEWEAEHERRLAAEDFLKKVAAGA